MSQQLANGDQDTVDLTEDLGVDASYGCTITRIIGELWAYPVISGIVSGIMRLDLGIAMIEEDALAAGAFPDPDEQNDRPGRGWLWRGMMLVQDSGGTAAGRRPERIQFAVRSQRKIDRARVRLIIDSNLVAETTFSVEIEGLIRMLCLLP